MTTKYNTKGECLICGSSATCGHEDDDSQGMNALRRFTELQNAAQEADELRAENEGLLEVIRRDTASLVALRAENERLAREHLDYAEEATAAYAALYAENERMRAGLTDALNAIDMMLSAGDNLSDAWFAQRNALIGTARLTLERRLAPIRG